MQTLNSAEATHASLPRLAKIALLFGAPLRRDEFLRRALEGSDWLKKYVVRELGSVPDMTHLERAWHRHYRPWIAKPFQDLKQRARRRGVEVCEGATLRTLGRATEQHAVVIVVGHWKGAEVTADDLRETSTDRWLAAVRRSADPLSRWLCGPIEAAVAAGGRGKTGLWSSLWRPTRQPTLAAILHSALDADIEGELPTIDGVDEYLEHTGVREARRREAMEEVFGSLLEPGNRLELFDGLHAKEVVEAAVAPGFEGVLDLTACTTAVLADHISECRDWKLRTVHFTTPLEPVWLAEHLALTLELMAEHRLDYLQARIRAENLLRRTVAVTARQRLGVKPIHR